MQLRYRLQAIRHIRHLLTTELAGALLWHVAWYWPARDTVTTYNLHAPAGSLQKLQHVQNTATRIILQAPKRSTDQPLLEQQQLHCFLVATCQFAIFLSSSRKPSSRKCLCLFV